MAFDGSGSSIWSAPLAGPQLLKEFRCRLEIGIDMEHAANQCHRVRPKVVDHKIASEPGNVIDTDHDVPVSGVDEVRAGFEFDEEIADAILLGRPAHIRDEAYSWRCRTEQHVVKETEHRILVEMPAAKVGLGPGPHLALVLFEQSGHIESYSPEMPDEVAAFNGIDKIHHLFAAHDPVADERIEDLIHLILAV